MPLVVSNASAGKITDAPVAVVIVPPVEDVKVWVVASLNNDTVVLDTPFDCG